MNVLNAKLLYLTIFTILLPLQFVALVAENCATITIASKRKARTRNER